MWYIYDHKTRKKVDGYFNSRNDALNMIKNFAFLYNCGMYAERTFWTFGRFGWCAHGGVYYRLPVKVWLHKSVGELNKDY